MRRPLTLLACAVLALGACTSQRPQTPPAAGPAPASRAPAAPWADLPAGPAPAVPYVHGRRYVTPEATRALPGGGRGVSAVVPYARGLLVADASYFEGTNGIALVRRGRRDAGWVPGRGCAGGGPVASADGRYVAWASVRCPESDDRSAGAVHRAAADGSGETLWTVGPGLVQAVGFLGREVVHNRGFRDGAWRAGDGGALTRIPGIDRAVAVSERTGLLIGQRGERARLLLDARGIVRWRATRGDLVSFGPDGTAVLAVDGLRLTVLRTADGSPRTALDLPAGVDASRVVWETGHSLLALAERDGGTAVVRLRLDGAVERATPIVSARAGRTPYVLLGQ